MLPSYISFIPFQFHTFYVKMKISSTIYCQYFLKLILKISCLKFTYQQVRYAPFDFSKSDCCRWQFPSNFIKLPYNHGILSSKQKDIISKGRKCQAGCNEWTSRSSLAHCKYKHKIMISFLHSIHLNCETKCHSFFAFFPLCLYTRR